MVSLLFDYQGFCFVSQGTIIMIICVVRNLRVKDTLGPSILSLVGRLSSFRKFIYTFGEIGSVLCREVVPFLECPLLEVSHISLLILNSLFAVLLTNFFPNETPLLSLFSIYHKLDGQPVQVNVSLPYSSQTEADINIKKMMLVLVSIKK